MSAGSEVLGVFRVNELGEAYINIMIEPFLRACLYRRWSLFMVME
jgi:hypothetical protein